MTPKTEELVFGWIDSATDKLAELEEKLDSMREYQKFMTDAGAKLEERLDAVESRSAGTSNYTRNLKERLDKLEKSKRRQPLLQEDIGRIAELVRPEFEKGLDILGDIKRILSRIR